MFSHNFDLKDKSVSLLVPVGPAELEVVVLEVLVVVDVELVNAGHEGLPPEMYMYTSLYTELPSYPPQIVLSPEHSRLHDDALLAMIAGAEEVSPQ